MSALTPIRTRTCKQKVRWSLAEPSIPMLSGDSGIQDGLSCQQDTHTKRKAPLRPKGKKETGQRLLQ